MRLSGRIRIQLAIFVTVALVAMIVMAVGYARLPRLLFGAGRYQVTLELPEAAGLYERANVTYMGIQAGEVRDVALTDQGVRAVLSLQSDLRIPADVRAEVHSQSAVGEQYVALLPQANDTGPALKSGDVIPVNRSSVPPDINSLLDATNRGLLAIPRDNLRTAIDESYTAFGGLGPEISRIVRGSTSLAIDARAHMDDINTLIDGAAPILDSQTDTADSIHAWAAHLADVTGQLAQHDSAVAGILTQGPGAADQARQLTDGVSPTLPLLLANLVSVNQIGITYHDGAEQLLVMLPQGLAAMQGVGVANAKSDTPYNGAFLSFNLNVNIPPPCTTGFLPVQQQRGAVFQDAPDRPAGDLYCRVPQDSQFNVRGARNTPCETKPGKRAPTVKMCESDEQYVPLNDGFNWKGDPNATLSGQSIPGDVPPSDPASPTAPAPDVQKTWQQMLLPGGQQG